MDDAALVRQAMAGGATAYEQLVRRWAARVLAVCRARVRHDADAAEDLAQEALVRGWRALPTLDDAARFGPWLCGIASRACLDWLKSPKRTETPLSAMDRDGQPFDVPDGSGGAATHAERHDDVRRLREEVDRLPDAYRETLALFYYGDLSYRDIAEALDVSPATVNARLTKARALLRARMTRPLLNNAVMDESVGVPGRNLGERATPAEDVRGL
jgi:RNA polymerase sigma-70 factor (ECF subfamily)